jgi:hypothetical protein
VKQLKIKRTIELKVTSKEPEIYLYKRMGVICRVGERGAKGGTERR